MKRMDRRLTWACGLVPLAMVGQGWAQTDGEEAIQPVGQRPPPVEQAPEIQAIPDIGGVLTPKGRLVIEPEFQYSHASVNRLTFRGVEILSTLQIGELTAEDIDRDTYTAAVTGRLGVTNRLELELRVPYLYRDDTANVGVAEADFDLERSQSNGGLGDVEIAAHYQINSGRNGGPFFVGNLRYKSTTGDGPFDIDYDENGVATELATGSGFHSIEPSLTMLMPSAPAVYFANLGYLFNLKDDVDETIGGVHVKEVDPGDAVRMSLGMAYSINPRSSFTLGYKNDFIQETDTTYVDPDTGNSVTTSNRSLNVGSMLLGWSYQMSDDSVLNLGLEFGVTEDAPDTTLTLRAPFGLNAF
ncbi:transporter [Halomonas getboli]|uniref:transporter n=1 Tax=Halomonas getboli TaxID=2935862 RepID=UPI001FFEF1C2|nr:transporter [Halomonas getboli]MCK2185027.1 transporter [Halomonas getboli]